MFCILPHTILAAADVVIGWLLINMMLLLEVYTLALLVIIVLYKYVTGLANYVDGNRKLLAVISAIFLSFVRSTVDLLSCFISIFICRCKN